MKGQTFDRHMQYGSSSRTITLGLGYWAMIAEIQEYNNTTFKDTMMKVVKLAHRETMSKKLHK